jgi:hypothetical protein
VTEPEQPPLRDVVQLVLPLPLEAVSPLLTAVGTALESLGYTDVSLRENAMHVVCARPPTKWNHR